MSEATVTVTGYVGTTPALHLSQNDVAWTSFRVGSTRRLRDAVTGEWRDGRTTWFTVKAFRGAARTVCESLVQGQPVVLTGRLSAEEWTDRDGRDRVNLVVDADAIGPDATRGMTRYTKVVHESGPVPDDEGGSPWAVPAAPDDARSLTGDDATSEASSGDRSGRDDDLVADDLTGDDRQATGAHVVDELTGEAEPVGG
ncbi:single-strand DNA-binding protein [Isoptericola sp. CG 20/1183]|uniref:Single-stranded DNA-binding protein n=1 Tax=Isoptericola halotolerans TaxID=300560 RepID=A0ABX5EEL6_9MICO|nr:MULTISPECIES: single-stranded DNA-binding protein [Isoptericola]PRZ07587.1 single-strand DNA-binding protein [Isoptericola halotolerans]PRZ08053.1 single-strand DNA-binding protein [Isoptericola sp. CG 20/1183]